MRNQLRKSAREGELPKKGSSKLRKWAGVALVGALSLNPGRGFAQEVNTLEQNTDEKEIKQKTLAVEETDSTTVNRNEAKEGLKKSEGGEISLGEIQEYIKNHKGELVQKVNEEIVEKFYEEVMENETIQEILQEMVNRSDIKQAVLDGNEQYVEQELKKNIQVVKKSDFNGIATLMILSAVISGVVCYKRGKKSANKR